MTSKNSNETLVTGSGSAGARVVERTERGERPSPWDLRDQVRWGPIVAGMLTALGTFLLLSLLGLAIGANTVRVGRGQGDEVAQGASIVTALIGLLSFFIGGFVAGRTAAVRGRGPGLLNGFLVWALGVSLILLLAALGVGQLFGAAGDLFEQYRALGSPDANVSPAQVNRQLRDAAIPAFLSMALPALAAAIGGLVGARDDRNEYVRQETTVRR